MLGQIKKLADIAVKSERTILGLMSGTSLDGLDIALCRVKGSGARTEIDVAAFDTMPFDQETRLAIKDVFAQSDASLQKLCSLNISLAKTHTELIKAFADKHHISLDNIDLIASHGQTVFHAPARPSTQPSTHKCSEQPGFNSTLQIVDGDHIARGTGVITISDFRQKHIAAGGEGAPLATYGDYLLFKSETESRILLNLGGIANITYLTKRAAFSDIVSTDTGPANTLVDAYVSKHFEGLKYDADGKIAATGIVDNTLLQHLLAHSFFESTLPMTTGPEEFSLEWLEDILNTYDLLTLSKEDVIATLVELTAQSITKAIHNITKGENVSVYASGGGVHNPVLVKRLTQLLLPMELYSIDKLGFQADAKEAVLFALLANECVAGEPSTFATENTNQPNVSMGKISLPD